MASTTGIDDLNASVTFAVLSMSLHTNTELACTVLSAVPPLSLKARKTLQLLLRDPPPLPRRVDMRQDLSLIHI